MRPAPVPEHCCCALPARAVAGAAGDPSLECAMHAQVQLLASQVVALRFVRPAPKLRDFIEGAASSVATCISTQQELTRRADD